MNMMEKTKLSLLKDENKIMGTSEHKRNTPENIQIGIITVSSSRTIKDDQSGKWIKKTAAKEGFKVPSHLIVTDEKIKISETVFDTIRDYQPNAIILTGGTGITSKDVTIEAVKPLFKKELSGFGTIFAQLSFKQIDSAAILSRATAGIIAATVVFCIPGSLKACKLACNELIFPELGHIIKHIMD